MLGSTYQWVEAQVSEMLETAARMHHDFPDDCLSDPFRIAQHWENQITVRRIKAYGHGHRQKATDESADTGPAGFCEPPEQTDDDGRYRLVINECKYRPRNNFTLLHELGHYLQHVDLDLWSRLYSFDDKATAKEAEETACNLFASKALMPDYLIDRVREGQWKADVAAKLYPMVRASRPAVVRRIAPLLQPGAWLTMLNRDETLNVRAYSNWSQEYGDLLDMEKAALRRFRKSHKSGFGIEEQTFVDLSGKDMQGRFTLSVARSPSSKDDPFWFILGQRQATDE